jgi:hypothetical protein
MISLPERPGKPECAPATMEPARAITRTLGKS